MVGNQAESSKIKRLEAALIQSKSEIQSLHGKIEDLSKEKVLVIITVFIILFIRCTMVFKENLETEVAIVDRAVMNTQTHLRSFTTVHTYPDVCIRKNFAAVRTCIHAYLTKTQTGSVNLWKRSLEWERLKNGTNLE